MEYLALGPLTKEEAADIFENPNAPADVLSEAIFRATYHVDDYDWITGVVLKFMTHSNRTIRRAAIICAGNIGRIYGRVDISTCRYLEQMSSEDECYSFAQDSLSDIAIFVIK